MNGAFVCIGIGIMFCHPLNQNQTQRPATTVQNYCHVYQRIIRNEEEAAQIGRLESRGLRERIAYNETFYRCECEGWNHELCRRQGESARAQVAGR